MGMQLKIAFFTKNKAYIKLTYNMCTKIGYLYQTSILQTITIIIIDYLSNYA